MIDNMKSGNLNFKSFEGKLNASEATKVQAGAFNWMQFYSIA
jgi:hypothetical protein